MTLSKSSIEDLFKDLLNEIKDFKYQKILKHLLSKWKENTDWEFTLVCLNSTTKAAVVPKYGLN